MKTTESNNLEETWKEIHSKLFQFIIKRVPQKADADDILQDVFLKIHNSINTLHNVSKLESWIFQITRYTIADFFRNRKSHTELPEELEVPIEEEEDIISTLTSSVNRHIENLSPEYREAIVFVDLQGNQQIQLAEKLGISVSGAKSRIQRGRKMIKDMFLDCCHFEFDSAGKVVDFHHHCCKKNAARNKNCSPKPQTENKS